VDVLDRLNASDPVLADHARVLDAMPIITWMAAADGTITYVSPAWEDYTGVPAADVVRLGYAHFVHPNDLPAVVATWNAARAARITYRDEVRLRFGDASFRWVLSQANPVRDESGDVIGWLGTVTDIHDRRIAEDALATRHALLEQSEERHRLMSESVPGTLWTATAEGHLDRLVDGRTARARRPASERLAEDWLDGIHPDDRERVRACWKGSVRSGEPYEATLRAMMADGTYRWHLARGLPQRDALGAVVGWVGVSIDIDDRVKADADREQFVKLAETSRDIIAMTDAAGTIDYVNPAAAAFLDTTREDLLGRHFFEIFLADDLPFVSAVVLPRLERGGSWGGDSRFRNFRTGRALPVMCDTFALVNSAGALSGFATISRDLRERQRIDIGMRAVADAGRAMHGSLDSDATMQNIANAVVAGFANVCSVEIPAADGAIRTITLAARNSADAPIAWQAAATRNAGMPPEHPIRWAIRDGISTLKQTLDAAFLASTGIDRHLGPEPGRLDICSLIFVPVRSQRDGRIYGVLSCGLYSGDPRGHYVEEDVRFAEEIAVRAGLAFDNAQAYERTRRVAVEMQAASLPSSLPQSATFRIHAEYRPATDEATIGGDWYDAFRLPDGRIAMTIGDVAGHGLQAATWMTRMRQAMQAAAMLDPDPRVMLGVANRTLRMQDRDVYATALAAIYDASARTLHVASAGHPDPVLARAGGATAELGCRGFLLGVVDEPSYDLKVVEIGPDDLLVFYTDGLVEVERDLDLGQSRLREALGLGSVRSAENPALAIFDLVAGSATVQDDVAILTLHALS
jgi:PAS domain S-box-containing protein